MGISRIDILDKYLNDSFKDSTGVLKEESKDSKKNKFFMQRRIVSGNYKTSLYKYDTEFDVLPFFSDEKGVKKMCDYIMFIEEGKHLFVFLIELKKGTESPKKQLDAGECFVNYILETIKRVNCNLNLSEANFHFRKIRISESRSNKSKIKNGIETLDNGVIEHRHPEIFLIKEYISF